MILNIWILEIDPCYNNYFLPMEVVHKDLIDFDRLITLIISVLTVNIPVMWITTKICGILFDYFFGFL